MATDPIVEQIAQTIEDRLNSVIASELLLETGDGLLLETGGELLLDDGFNQTFTVLRPARTGIKTVDDNLAVIEQGTPQPSDIAEGGIIPGNPPAQEWKQPWTVSLFSRQSDSDPTAAETYVNRMWADAVKAIANGDSWYTFGALARNAEISPPEMGVWDTPVSAVIQFNITVTYRTVENDPYTSR